MDWRIRNAGAPRKPIPTYAERYNRSTAPHRFPSRNLAGYLSMTTLREQIATTALTVTKFRDLMKAMRENRPSTIWKSSRKPTNSRRHTTPGKPAPQVSLI